MSVLDLCGSFVCEDGMSVLDLCGSFVLSVCVCCVLDVCVGVCVCCVLDVCVCVCCVLDVCVDVCVGVCVMDLVLSVICGAVPVICNDLVTFCSMESCALAAMLCTEVEEEPDEIEGTSILSSEF